LVAGISLGIVGSTAGISLWLVVPAHLLVMVSLLAYADRCNARDAPAPAPEPEPEQQPVQQPTPSGWDDDLAGLLHDDGRW
jgi:hypothetical protein